MVLRQLHLQVENTSIHAEVTQKPSNTSNTNSVAVIAAVTAVSFIIFMCACYCCYKNRQNSRQLINSSTNNTIRKTKTSLYGKWSRCYQLPTPEYENVCVICFGSLFRNDTSLGFTNLKLGYESPLDDSVLSSCDEELKVETVVTDNAYLSFNRGHSSDLIQNHNSTQMRKLSLANDMSFDSVVLLPCEHIFHENCVKEWARLHSNCPLCRFEPTESANTSQTTIEYVIEPSTTVDSKSNNSSRDIQEHLLATQNFGFTTLVGDDAINVLSSSRTTNLRQLNYTSVSGFTSI